MKSILVCAAFVAISAAFPAARAASIVQTTTLATSLSVIPGMGIDHYLAIAAYRFDPSLGTLDTVSFEYNGTISDSFTGGYDNGPPPPSGKYIGTVSVTLFGDYPAVSATSSEIATGVAMGTGFSVVNESYAYFDVSGTIGRTGFIATISPDTLVVDLVDAPVGRISSFSLTNAACGCTLPFLGSYGIETINTHATFTLTYGYTPVPEPASLAMFCFALAGLWSVRRLTALGPPAK